MQSLLKLAKNIITKLPFGAEAIAESWNSRYREIDNNNSTLN